MMLIFWFAVFGGLLFIPSALKILIVLFGLLTVIAGLMKLYAAAAPKQELQKGELVKEPFVSIMLTCCNEPFSLVNRTLTVLSRLKYSNFEVIVVDNNNTNISNYEKIEEHSKKMGKKFKFLHIDKVNGFKAGALNWARDSASPKTEIIAVIDADYAVKPNFLADSVPYFEDESVGIVQMPQNYSNITEANTGLAMDYRSFFGICLNQAGLYDAVTFTGTMGLLRSDLFEKGLRWNKRCITEDTNAGLRIHKMGYRGVFLDKNLGEGIMPLSFGSLVKQRSRWTYGNMQIMRDNLLPILKHKKFDFKKKLSFLTQLVTWIRFELFFVVFSIMLVLDKNLHYSYKEFIFFENLLAFTILFSLVSNFLFYFYGLKNETSIRNRVKAFFTSYGMTFVMSYSWFSCLLGKVAKFIVTDKSNSQSHWFSWAILRELLIPALLVVDFGLLYLLGGVLNGFIITSLVSLFVVSLGGIIYLNNQFIKSRKR